MNDHLKNLKKIDDLPLSTYLKKVENRDELFKENETLHRVYDPSRFEYERKHLIKFEDIDHTIKWI